MIIKFLYFTSSGKILVLNTLKKKNAIPRATSPPLRIHKLYKNIIS